MIVLLLLCVCFLHYYGRKKTVWGCFSLGGGGGFFFVDFFSHEYYQLGAGVPGEENTTVCGGGG
jgi:hypothetical protein